MKNSLRVAAYLANLAQLFPGCSLFPSEELPPALVQCLQTSTPPHTLNSNLCNLKVYATLTSIPVKTHLSLSLGPFFPLQVMQIPTYKHTENNGMPHPLFHLFTSRELIMQHKVWLILLMLHKKNFKNF